MLQTLLTLLALALAQPVAAQPPSQPAPAAQPAAAEAAKPEQVPPAPAGGTATPPASATSDVAGDPCNPSAPRPGKKKKEMPPVGARTDLGAGTYWMPPSAATNTDAVDWLFYGILAISIFCFAGVTIAVVYFAWKYRQRPGHTAEPSTSHSDTLEMTWTVIPSIICVIIFIFGWRGFLDLNTPPKHAYEIQVVAEKSPSSGSSRPRRASIACTARSTAGPSTRR